MKIKLTPHKIFSYIIIALVHLALIIGLCIFGTVIMSMCTGYLYLFSILTGRELIEVSTFKEIYIVLSICSGLSLYLISLIHKK